MRVQIFKITQIIIDLAYESASLLDDVIVIAQTRINQMTQMWKTFNHANRFSINEKYEILDVDVIRKMRTKHLVFEELKEIQ